MGWNLGIIGLFAFSYESQKWSDTDDQNSAGPFVRHPFSAAEIYICSSQKVRLRVRDCALIASKLWYLIALQNFEQAKFDVVTLYAL